MDVRIDWWYVDVMSDEEEKFWRRPTLARSRSPTSWPQLLQYPSYPPDFSIKLMRVLWRIQNYKRYLQKASFCGLSGGPLRRRSQAVARQQHFLLPGQQPGTEAKGSLTIGSVMYGGRRHIG